MSTGWPSCQPPSPGPQGWWAWITLKPYKPCTHLLSDPLPAFPHSVLSHGRLISQAPLPSSSSPNGGSAPGEDGGMRGREKPGCCSSLRCEWHLQAWLCVLHDSSFPWTLPPSTDPAPTRQPWPLNADKTTSFLGPRGQRPPPVLALGLLSPSISLSNKMPSVEKLRVASVFLTNTVTCLRSHDP